MSVRRGASRSSWVLVQGGLLVLLSIPGVALSQSDGPETVVDAFVRFWNAHDMGAFASLFVEDGDFLTATGDLKRDRAQIQADLEKSHAAHFKNTTLAAKIITVRLPRPDIAVIRFSAEMTGLPEREGKPAAPLHGLFLIVTAKGPDGWRIVAAQNTYARAQ